jgi:tryptophan-rich sensory protein
MGPHIGAVRITPTRAFLAIAFVGSLACIAYAILRVEDSAQIPMVTTGTAVLGLVFTALSVGGAIRMWRAWQDRMQGRTVLFAVAGGISGMIALGCFAGAIVLALMWGG